MSRKGRPVTVNPSPFVHHGFHAFLSDFVSIRHEFDGKIVIAVREINPMEHFLELRHVSSLF